MAGARSGLQPGGPPDASYRGRPLFPGELTGEAAVSQGGFNTYACYFASVHRPGAAVCADRSNPDLYGVDLAGKVLCLPRTTGSTSGGAVWQRLVTLGNAPAAVLFSQSIDPLAAGGLVVAAVWGGGDIVVVDGLGDEFLETVRSGDRLRVAADGTVTVLGR